MTRNAILFMVSSWVGVLGLVAWAFYRLLTDKKK